LKERVMIRPARCLIITLLLALTVLASASCGTRPEPSGVQGKAWSAGGPYPGTARPDSSAGIVLHAGDLQGEIVAKTTADASGAFKIDLPPGTYAFVVGPTFAITHAETVTVEPGKFVTVRLQSDMR
jgi:hypothetical protein